MSASHPTTRRAVAYYRCSTSHQEASIPEQRQWCQDATRRENLDVVTSFADEGVSGSEMDRRPGLMQLVEFCEEQASPPEVLVCWDADRLSRANSRRTLALLDRLVEAGVTHLFTNDGWVDLEDENDLLIFNIKQDTGRAAYSQSIAKNVTRSGLDRAKAGQWVAGKPPYGYRLGPAGRLVVHEDEAQVVRGIFAAVVRGDSLSEMVSDLNGRKVPSPSVGRKGAGTAPSWHRSTLYKIIQNPNYVGDLVWNRFPQGKYQRVSGGRQEKVRSQRKRVVRCNPQEEHIVTQDAHPSIVSRETFASAHDAMKGRRWKRTAPNRVNEWIFSGLVHCGDCGHKMYGRTVKRELAAGSVVHRKYLCGGYAQRGLDCRRQGADQGAILEAILTELQAIYADPGRLARLEGKVAAVANQANRNHAAETARLDAAIGEANRQIADAEARLLIIPQQHIDAVSGQIDAMKANREGLIQARSALIASITVTQANAGLIRDALALLGDIGGTLEQVPPKEARNVVELLVSKVTVVFDHDRPSNRSHASHIDIEFRPDIKKLLTSPERSGQLITVRVPLISRKSTEL